ncbi:MULTISPECIES: hypothetical protein [Roseomonadaceae]|uniref:Uracil-DNA glycosylase-like domain-containing protein n=1 Tax=Falsiroseomonas oleicola TaxID=2801474 RepID=A0ABS6HAZ8_9PROT|nr:hypothetical protein [Roseomonas oleicola]MBU8545868.1 hypothetical protein [Roseomonas oleicola]
MRNPAEAKVFIIGRNSAKTIHQRPGLDHEAYLDGLFNRNGASCRSLYDDAVRDSGPSPTRRNIDRLMACLAEAGVADVLQTNVTCFSTPMSGDLARPENQEGRANGTKIFETILAIIRPPILIAHGAGTVQNLSRILGCELPSPPADRHAALSHRRIEARLSGVAYAPHVFVIPSLAPPAWNKWQGWAGSHLTETCGRVRECLEDGMPSP